MAEAFNPVQTASVTGIVKQSGGANTAAQAIPGVDYEASLGAPTSDNSVLLSLINKTRTWFATSTFFRSLFNLNAQQTATAVVDGQAINPGTVRVTGSASSDSTLKAGTLEVQPYGLGNAWIGENAFYNGSSFVTRQTGAAGLFYFQGTEGQFRFAPSASAGTAVLATVQFKVNADGTVAFGPSMSNVPGNYTGATLLATSTGAMVNGVLRLGNYVVAGLPTPANSNLGATAFVLDATQTHAAGIGTVVAGGGSNRVPVYSDSQNWRIG